MIINLMSNLLHMEFSFEYHPQLSGIDQDVAVKCPAWLIPYHHYHFLLHKLFWLHIFMTTVHYELYS